MSQVEQLDKLNPGDYWVGNRIADYPEVIAQAPDRLRDDTDVDGRDCIAFTLYNEDLGPNASPPGDDVNPRTQLSSSSFMKRDGHYIIDHYLYIRDREQLPIWPSETGWFGFWEKYGQPYGGPPPLSWGTHDGETWGWYRGEPDWQPVFPLEPIAFGRWECVTWDFVNADPGAITVLRNGVVKFQADSFRCINDSDRDGQWKTIPHLYMERTTPTNQACAPDGVKIGPIRTYTCVRQLS